LQPASFIASYVHLAKPVYQWLDLIMGLDSVSLHYEFTQRLNICATVVVVKQFCQSIRVESSELEEALPHELYIHGIMERLWSACNVVISCSLFLFAESF